MDRDSDEISQHDVLLVPLVEATARLTARAPGGHAGAGRVHARPLAYCWLLENCSQH